MDMKNVAMPLPDWRGDFRTDGEGSQEALSPKRLQDLLPPAAPSAHYPDLQSVRFAAALALSPRCPE